MVGARDSISPHRNIGRELVDELIDAPVLVAALTALSSAFLVCSVKGLQWSAVALCGVGFCCALIIWLRTARPSISRADLLVKIEWGLTLLLLCCTVGSSIAVALVSEKTCSSIGVQLGLVMTNQLLSAFSPVVVAFTRSVAATRLGREAAQRGAAAKDALATAHMAHKQAQSDGDAFDKRYVQYMRQGDAERAKVVEAVERYLGSDPDNIQAFQNAFNNIQVPLQRLQRVCNQMLVASLEHARASVAVAQALRSRNEAARIALRRKVMAETLKTLVNTITCMCDISQRIQAVVLNESASAAVIQQLCTDSIETLQRFNRVLVICVSDMSNGTRWDMDTYFSNFIQDVTTLSNNIKLAHMSKPQGWLHAQRIFMNKEH